MHDIDIEYFSFPFFGGHVTYILVIISLSILYSQAGFLYNGTANIRLDFPCRREFSYFEIDFVDLALRGRAPMDVNLSDRQKGLKNE